MSSHSSSSRYNSAVGVQTWSGDSSRNKRAFAQGDSIFARLLGILVSLAQIILGILFAVPRIIVNIAQQGRFALVACVAVGLLVFGGVIDTLTHYNKVHEGVRIGELDVSGMTEEEVAALLNETYATNVSQGEVVFYVSEETMNAQLESGIIQDGLVADEIAVEEAQANKQLWRATSASLSAAVPSEQLASDAFSVGRENGVFSRLKARFLGYDIPFLLVFDEERIEHFASDIDATIGTLRVDFGFNVVDGVAEVTEGNDGEIVNRELLKQQITDAFAGTNGGVNQYVAQVEHAPVRINLEEAQDACDVVNDAIAHGAQFTCEGVAWEVSRAELGSWVTSEVVEDEKGRWHLQPSFDESIAKPSILQNIEVTTNGENLTVSFSQGDNGEVLVSAEGSLTIPLLSHTVQQMNEVIFEVNPELPSEATSDGTEAGVTDTSGSTEGAVVVAKNEPFKVDVVLGPMPDSMSFDDALDLGIVQAISTYTTEFSTGSGTENRNHNIHLGSEKINNSIAKAGETWSFQEVVGEVEEYTGFLPAGAILDDQVVDEVGGGICQVATTVFNAVYEGGYPIPVRHNHTMYMASYPAGRDAAVAWPGMDLIWENNSDSDILLCSEYTESTITVVLYGIDPHYTVSTQDGEWKKGDEYKVVVSVNDQISPDYAYIKTYGQNGSSFWIVRTVTDRNGEIVSTDRFDSVYLPKNEIIEAGSQEAGDKLKDERTQDEKQE